MKSYTLLVRRRMPQKMAFLYALRRVDYDEYLFTRVGTVVQAKKTKLLQVQHPVAL